MKRSIGIIIAACVFVAATLPCENASAQIPIINIITSAVKKVIVAIDLKVQQLQNKTIWLQNAEKVLENKMAASGLTNISGWLDKERNLYNQYYKELSKVKQVITDYEEVKNITKQQVELVNEYKSAYSLFKQDKNFNPDEINYMYGVYTGILNESIKNLDQLLLAVNSFKTQMTDEKRIALIHSAGANMQQNLSDLRQFNNGNIMISVQRAKENNDLQTVQQLYGLPKN